MVGEAKRTFSLPQLAELSGVEYGTLKTWVNRGLLSPSIRSEQGAGRPGVYSERDAKVAVALGRLRRNGLDMDALSTVAAQLSRSDSAVCPACMRSIDLSEATHA